MKIELVDIRKVFTKDKQEKKIFQGLNLDVKSGEFVVILGPNGSGKTTLLNMIAGLDKEYSGKIDIPGVPGNKNAFSYMMQKDLLLPWRTVYGNIVIGLEIQGKRRDAFAQGWSAFSSRFGLTELLDRYPSGLSGGERQKVALARTLVMDSDIVLLDEPFSAIDYNSRLNLQAMVYTWVKQSGRTAILVTHDIDEAIAVADRIVLFGRRPQGIIDDFAIDLGEGLRTPLTVRAHPNFADYYSRIWEAIPKPNEK